VKKMFPSSNSMTGKIEKSNRFKHVVTKISALLHLKMSINYLLHKSSIWMLKLLIMSGACYMAVAHMALSFSRFAVSPMFRPSIAIIIHHWLPSPWRELHRFWSCPCPSGSSPPEPGAPRFSIRGWVGWATSPGGDKTVTATSTTSI